MATFGTLLWILGAIVAFVSGLWLLVVAFQESAAGGIVWLHNIYSRDAFATNSFAAHLVQPQSHSNPSGPTLGHD